MSKNLHDCSSEQELQKTLDDLELLPNKARLQALLATNESGQAAYLIPGVFQRMGVSCYKALLDDANPDEKKVEALKKLARASNTLLRDFDRVYLPSIKLGKTIEQYAESDMEENTRLVYRQLQQLLMVISGIYLTSGGKNKGLARLLDFLYTLQKDPRRKLALQNKGPDLLVRSDLQKYVSNFIQRHFSIEYLMDEFEAREEQDKVELMALVIKFHADKLPALLRKKGSLNALANLIQYSFKNDTALCLGVSISHIIKRVGNLRKLDRIVLLAFNNGRLMELLLLVCRKDYALFDRVMGFLNEAIKEIGAKNFFRSQDLPPVESLQYLEKIKDRFFVFQKDCYGKTILHSLQEGSDDAAEVISFLKKMPLGELEKALKQYYADDKTREPVYAAENKVITQWILSDKARILEILDYAVEKRDKLILQYLDKLIDKTGLHAIYHTANAMISVNIAVEKRKIKSDQAQQLLENLRGMCKEAIASAGSMQQSVAGLFSVLDSRRLPAELVEWAGVVRNFNALSENQAAGSNGENVTLLCRIARDQPKQLARLLKSNKVFTILFQGLGSTEESIGPDDFKLIMKQLPRAALIFLLEIESSRTILHEAHRLYQDEEFMRDFFKEIIQPGEPDAILSLMYLSVRKQQEQLLVFLKETIHARGSRKESLFYRICSIYISLQKIDLEVGLDLVLKQISDHLKIVIKRKVIDCQPLLGPLAEFMNTLKEDPAEWARITDHLGLIELDPKEWATAQAGHLPLPTHLLTELMAVIPQPENSRRRSRTVYKDCTGERPGQGQGGAKLGVSR